MGGKFHSSYFAACVLFFVQNSFGKCKTYLIPCYSRCSRVSYPFDRSCFPASYHSIHASLFSKNKKNISAYSLIYPNFSCKLISDNNCELAQYKQIRLKSDKLYRIIVSRITSHSSSTIIHQRFYSNRSIYHKSDYEDFRLVCSSCFFFNSFFKYSYKKR